MRGAVLTLTRTPTLTLTLPVRGSALTPILALTAFSLTLKLKPYPVSPNPLTGVGPWAASLNRLKMLLRTAAESLSQG